MACPGDKIRSKGKGRGLGFGKGKGPIGIPVKEKNMKKISSLTDYYIEKNAAAMWDVAKSFAGQAKGALKGTDKLKNIGSMAKGHWGMLSGGQKAGLTAGAAAVPAYMAGRAS